MDKDFKDYIDSKTKGELQGTLHIDNSTKTVIGSDVLLQLLVFEHATGDVTVQTETGQLAIKLEPNGVEHLLERTLRTFYKIPFIREAIDKAVAEQYDSRPGPPYIERIGKDYGMVINLDSPARRLYIRDFEYQALCKIVGKELPVVDASESQVKSVWRQVFPPEVTATSTMHEVNMWIEKGLTEHMQRETAFTVWRLRVTR